MNPHLEVLIRPACDDAVTRWAHRRDHVRFHKRLPKGMECPLCTELDKLAAGMREMIRKAIKQNRRDDLETSS